MYHHQDQPFFSLIPYVKRIQKYITVDLVYLYQQFQPELRESCQIFWQRLFVNHQIVYRDKNAKVYVIIELSAPTILYMYQVQINTEAVKYLLHLVLFCSCFSSFIFVERNECISVRHNTE